MGRTFETFTTMQTLGFANESDEESTVSDEVIKNRKLLGSLQRDSKKKEFPFLGRSQGYSQNKVHKDGLRHTEYLLEEKNTGYSSNEKDSLTQQNVFDKT